VLGYGGSNKSFSVECNPVREEQLLQPLLLIQRRLDPQVRRPWQDTLCEGEDAFYVEFIEFDGCRSICVSVSSWRSLSRCRSYESRSIAFA
jgi:hypothetical protein